MGGDEVLKSLTLAPKLHSQYAILIQVTDHDDHADHVGYLVVVYAAAVQ